MACSPPSTLVLGAGELGTAMLNALSNHPRRAGVHLAVALRPSSINTTDPDKQKRISDFQSSNIEIVSADILTSSLEQLSTLFSPFHTVINCFGMTAPPGTQTFLVRAVLHSRAARYFPWQFGVDYDVIGRGSAQDLFTEQLLVREILREQREKEWVVVSTGVFTSFIFDPAFGVVDAARGTVTALGGWANRVCTTAVRDIGRVTAEIALGEAGVRGVVFVAGDTVSMADIADVVERVLGRKVRRVEKTVGQLREELEEDPTDGGKKYRAVFGEGVGVAWDMEKTFNYQKGIEMQTVEAWARMNLKP